MKKKFLLPALLALILCQNCNKEDINNKDSMLAGIISEDPGFVFFDFSPDIDIPNPSFEDDLLELDLDINKDGNNDLQFIRNEEGDFLSFSIKTLSEDFYIVSEEVIDYPRILRSGDPIDCDNNFKSGKFLFLYRLWDYGLNIDSGMWFNIDNKYFAFKFKSQNNWYLGWFKIGFVNNNRGIRLYEYAYMLSPDC